jgi:type IV secretory pathway VirJ component
MKHILVLAAASVALWLSAAVARAGQPTETLAHAAFGTVSIYAPPGEPQEVVLFISGDGGWNLGVVSMAERLRDLGALVVGIDIRTFIKSLEAAKPCGYAPGALEELSRDVQLHRKLPSYRRPILVGYSSGATLVYAALAAAPPETFAGGISLGFCPDLEVHNPPCRMRGLSFTKAKSIGFVFEPFAGLQVPWMVLQGEIDQVCPPGATRTFVSATKNARLFSLPKVGHGFSVTRNWDAQFVEAYGAVAAASPMPRSAPSTSESDLGLPLEEVPAVKGDGDALAVVLTGDGGWAEIDKAIATGLAEHGVSVVGWNSLRYYWTARTPDVAAADLARILERFQAEWKKERVLLVGYSFGADVLPFLVNRLPASARSHVDRLVLLGLSEEATFEFHLSSWLSDKGDTRYPTRAEVERLSVPTTCIYGSDEEDSVCKKISAAHVKSLALPGGHHFGGHYDRVVDAVIGK